MPQRAWNEKRERQYEHIKEGELRRGGTRGDRKGDRGPNGEQGAGSGGEAQGGQSELDRRHLFGPARRSALAQWPRRSYTRSAVQRSPREGHQRALEDDKGRARTGCRRVAKEGTDGDDEASAPRRSGTSRKPGRRREKRSIANMPATTRSALGKQGAAVAKRKRTGGSSPKTRQELYDEAKRRDLPGRSKMGRAELREGARAQVTPSVAIPPVHSIARGIVAQGFNTVRVSLSPGADETDGEITQRPTISACVRTGGRRR